MTKRVSRVARPYGFGHPTYPRPRQECDMCGKSIIFYSTLFVPVDGEIVKVIECDDCKCERIRNKR